MRKRKRKPKLESSKSQSVKVSVAGKSGERRFGRWVFVGSALMIVAGIGFVWKANRVDPPTPTQSVATVTTESNEEMLKEPSSSEMSAESSLTESSLAESSLTEPPLINTNGVDLAVVKSIELAREQVKSSIDSVRVWGELGMKLHAHGFADEASQCYRQCSRLDRTDARWPYLESFCVRENQPHEVIELLEKSVAIAGNAPASIRLTLVEILLEMFELDRAATHLDTFLQSDPTNPRARSAKGRLLFLRDDAQGCLDELQPLVARLNQEKQTAGKTKSMELLIAESFRRLGKIDESEVARRKAMTRREISWPDPIVNRVNRYKTGLKTFLVQADRLYGVRRYDESIVLLRNTIQSYPDSLWAHILLGRALVRTGAPDSQRPDRVPRLKKAEQVLRRALELDPNSVEAQFRLGVVLTYQDRMDEAAIWYASAIKQKPDFTMAHYNLAQCQERAGDIPAAIASLQRAVRTQPNYADARHLLGFLLQKQGDFAGALKQLTVANQLRPNDNRIQSALEKARRSQN